MYVTRRLSSYKQSPDALSLPPPEGPNSGILVIQDDHEIESTHVGSRTKLKDLPLPQNKSLELNYRSGIAVARNTHYHHVAFIPVLDQPLSSNRYYVIQLNGKHRGDAYTALKEEDLGACCFFDFEGDVPPQPFDINNINQQYEIHHTGKTMNLRHRYAAKSVNSDGVPPKFLSRKWKLYTDNSMDVKLVEAQGVDNSLRSRLPDFNFSINSKSSNAVVVGKWYCPLMFIRETSRAEGKRSMFYEMTLEQKWEQIFSCENSCEGNDSVIVHANVQAEVVIVGNREAVVDKKDFSNGWLWVLSYNNVGEATNVGISTAIVERVKWEQQRVGWNGEKEKYVTINREEKFEGIGMWQKFGCYILVEKFVLKRLDGSVVLSHEFKHTHQLRIKWE